MNSAGYSVTGATAMAGLTLNVAYNTPINSYTDPVNPATGTDIFFSTMLDPDGNGVVDAAVATGRKNIGTAGTSKAIVFGFPFEDIVDVGTNSKAAVFTRLLAY